MTLLIVNEMKLFGICFLLGMALAFFYDLIRIFRLLIRHRDLAVDIEDLCFWLLTAWLVFETLFQYNQGALRGYAFFGMFTGVIIYISTISRLLLFLVKKILPAWDKGKACIKKPFLSLGHVLRKILKNMIFEVKMAIKSR